MHTNQDDQKGSAWIHGCKNDTPIREHQALSAERQRDRELGPPDRHTPGPWAIDDSDGGLWVHPEKDWDTTVADCGLQQDPSEERKANARLIAAAPEMLEALRAVVEDANHDMLCELQRHYDPLQFIPVAHSRKYEAKQAELKATEPPCSCFIGRARAILDKLEGE